MKKINYTTQGTTITQFVEVINEIMEEVPYPTQGTTQTFKEEIVYTPEKEV